MLVTFFRKKIITCIFMSEPYIFAIKPQIHPSPLFVSIILNRMSIMNEIDYSK